MMVLRHIRPPLSATVTLADPDDAEDESCPIDLSNKHPSSPSEVPRPLSHRPTNPLPGSPRPFGGCRSLAPQGAVRWREVTPSHFRNHDDEENSLEEEEFSSGGENVRQNFIPLSRIQQRYQSSHSEHTSPNSSDPSRTPDKVLTKRARLDCLISHIKQSKPSRDSGECSPEDRRGGEEAPNSLRNSPIETPQFNLLGMDRFRIHATSEDEEPCNLACSQRAAQEPFESWAKGRGPLKGLPPLSPSDAAKDPEAYQQHLMQLQLASAAMMGDNGEMMKAMQGYPPWFLLNYYSQLLHNFQTSQLIRQYAIQSNTPPGATVSPEEKSPSTPRSALGASGYNCQSPLSPASLSEGHMGGDSDGGSIGHMTPGSINGKRAPRAMTGRHVRTGTGASPATLQTLRNKIEERQRLKAQQLRSAGLGSQSAPKSRNGTLSNHGAAAAIKLQKKSKK